MTKEQFEEYKKEKISYDKTWDNLLSMLYELDGVRRAILSKSDILYVCNASDRSFNRKEKDGIDLPFGFKVGGVWRFSIGATVKWLMRGGDDEYTS